MQMPITLLEVFLSKKFNAKRKFKDAVEAAVIAFNKITTLGDNFLLTGGFFAC